jgi:serine/threonine protein kinase
MKVVAKLEYEKLGQIGVGQGMNSTVHLARDPQLAGDIAVKEVPLSSFANPLGYFTEAQAMFAANHQNVVPVLYAGTTATDVCIAMPYYPRGSLASQIATAPPRLSDVLRYGQDVLAGLAQIHRVGHIHFDVKPSNVLLSDTGRALVADFGQSRAIGPGGAVTVPLLYRHCVPPEVFSGGAATILADVYQAGLLLYRLVNGDAEWQRQVPADVNELARRITKGRFPDRSRFLPHVSDRLRRVIRKALSVDPADRFQSATEFADALGRVPLPLDWQCSTGAGAAMSWRAERAPRPALIVELQPAGGNWNVAFFTDGTGKRRARDRATAWRSNLKGDEAYRHLRDLFRSLS